MATEAPRHILFSVAGMTPAVITETLYGLYTKGVTGGEIHVLTTSQGRRTLVQHLLEEDGQVAAFNRAYGSTWEIRYEWIEAVLAAGDGGDNHNFGRNPMPLSDLRNTADNAIVANTILERVRYFTSDPQVILHASVAGGRKTMGLFLSQAMSWFARVGDDLSHVLVDAKYENPETEFFFPIPNNPEHEGVVDYAPLPFVRLRGALPELIRGAEGAGKTFTDLVRLSQIYLDDTLNRDGRLILHRSRRTLTLADEIDIHLQPLSVGLYEFLFFHANIACDQDPFVLRNAFAYRSELAECLENSAPDQITENKKTGLSALQFRNDPDDWPERWLTEAGTVVENGKRQDVALARQKELSDAFGNLQADFKALPWDNASFQVYRVRKGPARYVDIDPARLSVIA